MKIIFELTIITTILLGLTGCAMVPESIDLKPVVNTPVSNIGNGKKVAVQIIDARTQKNIGSRATYIGSVAGADITLSNESISASTEKLIFKGLKNYNFEPIQYSVGSPYSKLMRLSIIDLEYKEIPHPFNIDIYINNTIKVEVYDNGKIYEKIYRKQKVHTIGIAPPTSQDEIYINEVFSDTLKQILTDKKLLKILTKS